MAYEERKCPGCGASMRYDPSTRGLTCDYCGHSEAIPEAARTANANVQEIEIGEAKFRSSTDWGMVTRTIICKQCGAATVNDAMQMAGRCPFCGSTTVIPAEDEEKVIAPNAIVPFAVTREQAEALLTKWMSRRFFSPGDFKRHVDARALLGVYLPYWTFDTDTTTSYSGKFGYTVSDGDSSYTRWEKRSGVYKEFIDDFVVCGSRRVAGSKNIAKLARLEQSSIRPYAPEMLAGFVAERYSIGIDEAWNRAVASINKRLEKNIKRHEHADELKKFKADTDYDNITFKYFLTPFWIVSYKYKGKVYDVVINGHNGRLAGDAPLSGWRVLLLILGIFAFIIGGIMALGLISLIIF